MYTARGTPDGPSTTYAAKGVLTRWLLDTRPLWPGDNILSAKGAAQLIALLTGQEQNLIREKMFVRDAKESLGSALLKRAYVCRALQIPWKDARLGRRGAAKYGKPCAVDANGDEIADIDFNVSHQNGIVVLTGVAGSNTSLNSVVKVGVDIIHINTQRELDAINMEGLNGWCDMYEGILSWQERKGIVDGADYVASKKGSYKDLKSSAKVADHEETASNTSRETAVYKMRRLYTFLCLKEAYTKLAGEGIVAPWIEKLEFSNVKPPAPCNEVSGPSIYHWGETIDDIQVQLKDEAVRDVVIQVQALNQDFICATAIQGNVNGVKIPTSEEIRLDEDIHRLINE